MQIPQLAGEQLLQIKVQLLTVLQHTVAKMGSQSRVTAIQPVPLDVLFQYAIGPSAVFPAGDQRIERSFSRTHGLQRMTPKIIGCRHALAALGLQASDFNSAFSAGDHKAGLGQT